MSSAAGRRKRAAPKVNVPPAPAPIPVVVIAVPEDPLLRTAQAAGVLLISQAQESMAQRGQRADDGRGHTHAYATVSGSRYT